MNGDLPPGYTERPISAGGDSGLPPGYTERPLSKFPKINTPGEVAEGVGTKIVNALTPPDPREHPVEFALYTASQIMPFMGKFAGPLGEGLSGMALRTGAMTGVGAGTAAATGKPVMPAAGEGAAMGVGGELLSPIARKITGLGTAKEAATQETREGAADYLSERALENELGVTRGQAQKLKAPTSVGEMGAQERKADVDALAGARQSALREVGEKYEPIYGPIENQPVTPDRMGAIGGAATESQQWLNGKGAKINPSTQRLLAKQATLSGAAEPVEGVPQSDPMQGAITEVIRGGKNIDAATKARYTQLLDNEFKTKGQRIEPERLRELARQALGGPQKAGPTIGQLRGHLGQIMTEANKPGTSALERRALMKASTPIIETLNKAIPDQQRPLLQQINNEYAQINRIFPWKGLKQISSAATIPELGQLAFGKDNVAATAMAVPRMSEPQKQLMRRAFGSYILSETDSPTATVSKLAQNKDTVAALYKGSPFEKIGAWRDAMIEQKKFLQGPPNLPSQQQFEQGLQDIMKKSGLTPEAIQAANDALTKTGGLAPGKMVPHGFGRYLLLTAPLMGMMGWGPYHHAPELIAPAALYYGGMIGWRQIADNPALLDGYRKFIMSGWTRTGGEMFGRLILNSMNDELQGAAPQHQVVGHQEPGEGRKALDTSRAEHIAPTPSASDRAEKVNSDLGKGKTPEIHRDLSKGRLTTSEVDKLVGHASKTDATAMLDDVPLSESLDAAEVASPEERKMLLPLLRDKLANELTQEKNRTLQAKLSQRFKKLQGMEMS